MNESNKKPTAHLICGFIGSGKTTFAKKLQNDTGALRFTKDEWVIRIFGNNPKKIEDFDEYDERMKQLCLDIALVCLKAGNDIIFDDGLWVKSDRKLIRKKVENVGGNPQFYYIKCPEKTMKQRALKRNKESAKDTFCIDEEMFESYKKYFEEFDLDENYIVIDND